MIHILNLKRKFILFTVFLIAFLICFVGLRKVLVSAATSNAASFLISTGGNSVQQGKTFVVNLGLDNFSANNVIAADAILNFDSNLFEVVGVQRGTTGLATLVPGDNNVFDITKAVSINATDSAKSTLDIGLIAFDQDTNTLTTGVTGTIDPDINPLVKITFKAIGVGSGQISFKFDSSQSTTDSNIAILNGQNVEDILTAPTQSIAMSVIYACTTIDFNSTGDITIGDIQAVSSRWGAVSGDANYDVLYDLDKNGTISIKDIQLVSSRFAEACYENN